MLNNCFKLTSIPICALLFHLEFWLLVGGRLEGATGWECLDCQMAAVSLQGALELGKTGDGLEEEAEAWHQLTSSLWGPAGPARCPSHLSLFTPGQSWPVGLLEAGNHLQGWGGRQRSPFLLSFWFSPSYYPFHYSHSFVWSFIDMHHFSSPALLSPFSWFKVLTGKKRKWKTYPSLSPSKLSFYILFLSCQTY